VRQGLRPVDAITREETSVTSYGYSGQAASHLGGFAAIAFGGEIYDEHIGSWRLQGAQEVRPLYLDGSRYTSGGAFGHIAAELGRVRAAGGGRLSSIHSAGRVFRDFTYNGSIAWQAAGWLGVHAVAGRGFRAPNLNDLGALGLNDLGFEIPAAEALPHGALLSISAAENALPAGRPLHALGPEQLFNFEAGVRINARRMYARVQAFDAELLDPIVRRTLLFSAGAIPSTIAGLPVTPIPQTAAQREQGVITVATASDPRAVKAFVNDGKARYYGTESMVRFDVSSRWSAHATYTFLYGRELNPNRNVRRLPPQTGFAAVRYAPRAWWVEAGMRAAGAQERLSGGDLDDERIGASRSRRDISDFYAARPGLIAEPLNQLLDRVLPGVAETVRVPLYTSTPGWWTFDTRAGFRIGEHTSVITGVMNVFDRNYRIHGSGVDSPGVNVFLTVRRVF
jgi:outer membrane receptor protein involved in Fe transport